MFYRATKLTGKVYVVAFEDFEDEIENIKDLVSQGEPVYLSDDLEEIAEHYGINKEDLILI